MEEKQTKNNIRTIFLVFLTIVGFVTTIKLATIYYESNFDPYALPSFCSINEFIDCDGVAQTSFAQFLGIPLAYWGMFFYSFILLLIFSPNLKDFKFLKFLEVFKNPYAYISILGIFSFCVSMILAGISLFEIKKLCILCVATYILDLLIAIIATDFKVGLWNNLKTCINDFKDAIKIKKYLVSFFIVSLLACGFLAYTKFSYVFTPQVKRYESIKQFADLKTNPFKSSGNILGDKDAKVVVDIYSDYRCPICYTENLMIYRVAKELANVKFVHHNLPLDIDCNRNLTQPFHQGSCMMARYAFASEKQGKLWDLNSELFEQQPNDEKAILKIAKKLGLDTDKLQKDANSEEAKLSIEKDINDATNLNIDGTPAIILNGKIYSGVKPYYELTDMLKKAGAVDRK
ncbi:thioredoxin domain-containing protein [bacterium]|nr:thioredoxin domain-containing protein [bacterium]